MIEKESVKKKNRLKTELFFDETKSGNWIYMSDFFCQI